MLLIAGINFVNLSSAKSISRAMEIGVRKASGASKGQLYLQFVSESILISMIAMVKQTIEIMMARRFSIANVPVRTPLGFLAKGYRGEHLPVGSLHIPTMFTTSEGPKRIFRVGTSPVFGSRY